MKDIKIKEVTTSSIYVFLEVIRETLIRNKDTQIFISNKLFKRLSHEYKNSIIWKEDVLDSFYYTKKEEKAFIFKINDKTFQMHFVSNSLDYMHLTYFASKGIIYQNRLNGMKTILIINTDQK